MGISIEWGDDGEYVPQKKEQPAAPVTTCDAMTDEEYERQVTAGYVRRMVVTYTRRFYKRGTPIHGEWVANPQLLIDEAGARPSPAHTFGALDESKGLVPGNVGWQTDIDRKLRAGKTLIEYEGKLLTIPQLSGKTGIPTARIRQRIAAGYSGADLWSEKHLSAKYDAVQIGGQTMRLAENERDVGNQERRPRARTASNKDGKRDGEKLFTPVATSPKRAPKGTSRTKEYIDNLKREKELRKAYETLAKYGVSQVVTAPTMQNEED